MPPRQRFRIVTWNVRYFSHAVRGLGSTRRSRHGIAGALADLRPTADLVCLQEIESRSLRSRIGRPPEHPSDSQLELFMGSLEERFRARGRRMPYEAIYFPAHRYGVGEASLYTTGLAVLVHRKRFSVKGHNADAPVSITHVHPLSLPGAKQTRIVAHVELGVRGGRRLHVFNTHVSLPTPFSRAFWEGARLGHGANQVAEVRKLAAYVRERAGDEPYLLCGDFNAPPGSPVYRTLVEELRCTGAQAGLGHIDPECPDAHPTAGFLALRMHLDHLFAGGAVRWVDLEGTHPFGSGPFHALSDHVPLIGRFELTKDAAGGRSTPPQP